MTSQLKTLNLKLKTNNMPVFYKNLIQQELIDTHIHLGAAVPPYTLWEIAKVQGFKLPVSTYWDFWQMITVDKNKTGTLSEYLNVLHNWTEKIQSSPLAMEMSVYMALTKQYRKSNVKTCELRFNPLKRNQGGEIDVDHVIQAAIRGMDRAVLDYGLQVGLIFCLGREFNLEKNRVITQKAIKYASRGVVGLDVAGDENLALENSVEAEEYHKLFVQARSNGLSLTLHCGEIPTVTEERLNKILDLFTPQRIGHGIQLTRFPMLMKKMADRQLVLEICPSSNLATGAVKDWNDLKERVQLLLENGVKLSLNTDGPYVLQTTLAQEIASVLQHKVMTMSQVEEAQKVARQTSFLTRI